MYTFDTSPVQTTYSDNWVRAYPGTYESLGNLNTPHTYPVGEDLVYGRATSPGFAISRSTSTANSSTAPYSIVYPDGFEISQLDMVGVIVRPTIPGTNVDQDGVVQAGALSGSRAAVIPFGSQAIVFVQIPPGVTIVAKSVVYVAISATNTPGIPIGSFWNASGTGLIPIAATWYDNIVTAVDYTVARIRLT